MPETHYDLAVIGAGPGGYVCAIRAAQLGFKTALIDKRAELGGTCLNVGCIPSKALLHSTELYHALNTHGKSHGIQATKLALDVAGMMKNKDNVVAKLNGGVKQLVSKRDIAILQGTASLEGSGKIKIAGESGTESITAKHIVIATGSIPTAIPALPFDGKNVVSSDQAIAFDSVPAKLVVVGGGAIGLELGSVWGRLGSEVTVIEFMPQIAPACDADIAKLLARALKKQGVTCETGTSVKGIETTADGIKVLAEKGDKKLEFPADKVLVAVGRRPFTTGLGLEKVGIELDAKGRIAVDKHFKTSVEGIYAIGDVIEGPMLAHKAEDEGVALAEILAGKAGHVNYETIPAVIYTDPEVASVGIGEDFAKKQGLGVNVGKFAIAANGRAIASDATDGIAKVIACAQTDRILGVQIMAAHASEIIGSAVTHMEYRGSAEDLARTVTAHPTISEALKEAALAVEKRAIHALA